MMPSSTSTGKVSTGTYAGRVMGLPVRRSNSEPWRGHSTVQVSGVELALGERTVVVRAAVLDGEELPSQLKTPISRSSQSTSLRSPGGQFGDGAEHR